MNIEWCQTRSHRSWHAYDTRRVGRGGWGDRALCGKLIVLTADVHAERPDGKSCETCLRILTRAQGE